MYSKILVPSYKRAEQTKKRYVSTLNWLVAAGFCPVLFVRPEEAVEYRRYWPHLELWTTTATNIAETRDDAVRQAAELGVERLLMFDDDLTFRTVLGEGEEYWSGKTRNMTLPDVRNAVNTVIDACTAKVPMTGMVYQMFSNSLKEVLSYNKRIQYAVCLHVPTVIENGWTYSWEAEFMEDFQFQLSVLQSGYTTVRFNRWLLQSPQPQAMPGGCSEQRTPDKQTAAAVALCQRFPEYVRLRYKYSKTWNTTYADVSVSFNKFGKRQ